MKSPAGKAHIKASKRTGLRPDASGNVIYTRRIIGTTRRELLDQGLFFNELDLLRKLNSFKDYFNIQRSHSSLEQRTPKQIADEELQANNITSIENYQWKPHVGDLYRLPVAA